MPQATFSGFGAAAGGNPGNGVGYSCTSTAFMSALPSANGAAGEGAEVIGSRSGSFNNGGFTSGFVRSNSNSGAASLLGGGIRSSNGLSRTNSANGNMQLGASNSGGAAGSPAAMARSASGTNNSNMLRDFMDVNSPTAACAAGGGDCSEQQGLGGEGYSSGSPLSKEACTFQANMKLLDEGIDRLARFIESTRRVRGLSLAHNAIGPMGAQVRG